MSQQEHYAWSISAASASGRSLALLCLAGAHRGVVCCLAGRDPDAGVFRLASARAVLPHRAKWT